MFNKAIDWGWYEGRNPARAAKRDGTDGVVRFPEEERQGWQTQLSDEQLAALDRAIDQYAARDIGRELTNCEHDGGEAIRICEQHLGPIHLLVSDVVMPQIGGRQLAEQLIALRPEMRVLFMSGYTDDAVIRHGVLQAEVQFLQKPFTVDALTRKVRAVLDGVG